MFLSVFDGVFCVCSFPFLFVYLMCVFVSVFVCVCVCSPSLNPYFCWLVIYVLLCCQSCQYNDWNKEQTKKESILHFYEAFPNMAFKLNVVLWL